MEFRTLAGDAAEEDEGEARGGAEEEAAVGRDEERPCGVLWGGVGGAVAAGGVERRALLWSCERSLARGQRGSLWCSDTVSALGARESVERG